jgi:hypothetical protein
MHGVVIMPRVVILPRKRVGVSRFVPNSCRGLPYAVAWSMNSYCNDCTHATPRLFSRTALPDLLVNSRVH